LVPIATGGSFDLDRAPERLLQRIAVAENGRLDRHADRLGATG